MAATRSITWRGALTDAFVGGLVAAALALPMLGFRLVDSALALSVGFRLDWVLWAALVVFAGRLALNLLRMTGGLPDLRLGERLSARMGNTRHWASWAMIGFATVLPFLPFSDRSLVDKATMVLIYVMLGWGLNIVVGLAGLLDLGFVAFYAVGAYSYALLSTTFGWSFWVCLPLAGLFAAGFGVALGFPVLRLRGDYLAIVTLGFGEIIRVILQNWQDLTGGPAGISGIPRPTLFGLPFLARAPEGGQTFAEFFGLKFSGDHRVIFLYFVILMLALLTNLFTLRIRRLPVGRAWEALREDEIACRSLGLNPTTIKLSAFATGAMFAGFAGSFFATRQGFISPESFTFIESAVILAIVVLGGMGSQVGVVLAALLLVGLPEWFRELQQYRMLAFGGAMVLIMLWRPSGLLSSRSPTISLGGGK
ncbi:high-affinity branched-chain amino acid ABC transporter permease LivM [Magnetospirillum aberrantis]|uniref:High-affinity branched-chain amino acid ABC transporter permease LivM n=1 Tax=Magnetospirillum aberrantis SpK TaxID=908842 RepID=A0A7C9QTR4_9PROT|nr:high-affinity branched-chain amino acid ABC transporter permease LivM [Magnetospirillum aberrantis]NFV80097.1 high-affinity branched-chain amino acid ABC transporter permease LivM [Magnetospirillum aberrantis SpK]